MFVFSSEGSDDRHVRNFVSFSLINTRHRIISIDADRFSKLMNRLRTEVTAYEAVRDASQVSRFISWSKVEQLDTAFRE